MKIILVIRIGETSKNLFLHHNNPKYSPYNPVKFQIWKHFMLLILAGIKTLPFLKIIKN